MKNEKLSQLFGPNLQINIHFSKFNLILSTSTAFQALVMVAKNNFPSATMIDGCKEGNLKKFSYTKNVKKKLSKKLCLKGNICEKIP